MDLFCTAGYACKCVNVRICPHKDRYNVVSVCCVCPAWEQLLAVQEAEQRLYRCDDVEYAWRKAATQREITTVERRSGDTVKTHFQTQSEDQGLKNSPKVVADAPDCVDYFTFQRSHVAFMFAGGEKVLTGPLLQFISRSFYFSLTLVSIPAAFTVSASQKKA